MRKHICTILSAALTAVSASAAIPLRWTVETSRVQPVTFEAYHGETLELEASLQSYGKPVADTLQDARIYWQTNGMGSAYWSAPASAEGGVLRATWTPAMDTGAAAVNGFIGVAGEIYRASFQLRLRPSPGAEPNLLTVPPAILDLSKTVVINPPWPTDETIMSAVREVVAETGIQAGVDEDEVKRIVSSTVDRTLSISGAAADANTVGTILSELNTDIVHAADSAAQAKYNAEQANIKATNALERAVSAISSIHNLDSDISTVNSKADTAFSLANQSKSAAQDALAYANGVYNYMNANTNAWFAGTNYVVGASATTRHKFTFEAGMDLSTVPCSMSLWERRDGEKSAVWDQRDWVSWYWSFKASQMQARINATNEALRAEIAAKAPAAWAKRTAATGLVNPDETTTWIDTKTVTLSPGMAWETVATVDGCGYWTIVGNGATIGGSDKSPLLSIKDFEGNEVLKIKKTASYMAYINSADFVAGGMRDADGRICFDVRSDVQPVGEFSTTLVNEDFVAEDSDGCPALYEWENIGGGKYRIHFILKPGIVSNACFARFKVEVQGETTVEYSCGQTISGGLIYDGVKIAPVVTKGAAVGTTVTWKVVR